ncbi:MAG TPA: hypothetical protein VL117_03280 [Thermoleophilia bacterium]|nr:hypothetical protein [Thermoleophilia bacterium]
MTAVRFQDLPLADRDRSWSADAAEGRVRRWAGATEAPNARYRKAFLWYDAHRGDEFTAYKLPIADVIGGELRVVPRAVMSAAQVVSGARGGVDLPAREVSGVKRTIARYYEKFGEQAPWERKEAA